jgi:hypothetical protein
MTSNSRLVLVSGMWMSDTVTVFIAGMRECMPMKDCVFSELRVPVSVTRTSMLPRSVYLQALVNRFRSICQSHSSSVMIVSLMTGETWKSTGTCLP